MIATDGQGIPIGLLIESASTHEVKLLERTLREVSIKAKGKPGRPRKKPKRVIADKAYDSNDARRKLSKIGIEPIIPARHNNANASHQDGRKLRRYRHRWTVERTISWIQNCRRLVVRYERSWEHWLSFIYLACGMLVLRRVIG